MRRVRLGLLVGICAWSLAGPAPARDDDPPPAVPANAPVVASVAGARLVAFDHHGDLCLALSDDPLGSCNAPPHGYFDPDVEGSSVNRTQVVYGVTATDATSIDVLTVGGKRVSGPVGGGAYAGQFAGRVRFFAVAVTAQPYRVLLRDAAGRVVGGADFGPSPPIGRPVAVQRGRLGGRTWHAAVYQTTHLRPSPLDRGRIERLTCVRIVFGSERPVDGGCSGPEADPGVVSVVPREHCAPSALVVSGLAGPSVRRIDAVLGDGTRRRVRLHALPAGFGDRSRTFALVLGAGMAVRSLLVVDGGRGRDIPLRQAPGGATCAPRSPNSGSVVVSLGMYDAEPHGGSTGPLVARDQGDLLCVGLGAIVAADCQIPPFDPLLARLQARRSGGHAALLAVVPPEVASVRLTVDSGPPITAPTTDLPGYSGQYAGVVRAAAVPLPPGRKVYDVDELAADGHVLDRSPGPDLRPLAHTPAVLARLPGGVVVAGGDWCVQVGTDAPTRDRSGCRNIAFQPILVAAPCAARRVVVVARSRRLDVVTDRGVIRGRRKGRFAVALVPGDEALREVRTAVSVGPVRLPPAARQCGYALQT